MQKVIYLHDIQDYTEYIDPSVVDYIRDGLVETYESYERFDLIAFDCYDLSRPEEDWAQVLIYLDADDLFFICENEGAFRIASRFFAEGSSNEQALFLFFRNLFKGSSRRMEEVEERISRLDDAVAAGATAELRELLSALRSEVLWLKQYHEHLEFLFEELCENDNSLISSGFLPYFEILRNRSIRLVSQAQHLRDYVAQVRESYQAQIGIEQNNLMKIFTLVTSIFLPLTLIVGWYGMNLKMPEFGWEHGYLYVIGLCAVISLIWFLVFKRKNWFR